MKTFSCTNCQGIFYSMSFEKEAKCPNCGSASIESASQKIDFDTYVRSLRNRGGGCKPGGGCCG